MVKKPTMQEIAHKAGVTRATVSYVLNNTSKAESINPETKSRIREIARQLQYTPNPIAKALVTGKTWNIGFLISSKVTSVLANSYFGYILSGVQMAASRHKYNCVVKVYDLGDVESFVVPDKFRQRSVDGVIIVGNVEGQVLDILRQYDVPFMLIGETSNCIELDVMHVCRDMCRDLNVMFDYLTGMRHTKIVAGSTFTRHAVALFDKAIAEFQAGRPDVTIDHFYEMGCTEGSFARGCIDACKWIKSGRKHTAALGNDQWCVGFLSEVLRAGYECPGDISVVATCDSDILQWYRPSVTAFSQPLAENAFRITEAFIDYIEKKTTSAQIREQSKQLWVHGELKFRESSEKR